MNLQLDIKQSLSKRSTKLDRNVTVLRDCMQIRWPKAKVNFFFYSGCIRVARQLFSHALQSAGSLALYRCLYFMLYIAANTTLNSIAKTSAIFLRYRKLGLALIYRYLEIYQCYQNNNFPHVLFYLDERRSHGNGTQDSPS